MARVSVPEWVDRHEYPFAPRGFTVDAGVMSYIDEGSGDPVVMVHGNPTWSWEYRHLTKALSGSNRCIVPDHIGFGLSEKPAEWRYLPEQHAANLDALLESLDLHDVTLVVGDWGGPIGLSWAMGHPQRVKSIVITNSWCWPVDDDWYFRAFSGFVGGPIGRRLIRKRNFFARTIVGAAFGDKTRLTAEVRRHVETPLAVPEERKGNWVFPGEIVGSTAWLRQLWDARGGLDGKVRLIAWGMKDIAFREQELNRWIEAFPDARVARFPDAGHFLAEERPVELLAEIRTILGAATVREGE
jgi:haloalkane dehalogenase